MTKELNEVPFTTPNFATEAASQLAKLFPEIVADGKINLDTLKTILDVDIEEEHERFGLTWPGKRDAIRAAQTPTTATLMPDKHNSIDWDTTQNVFIEGDNLEVLKILQKHYYGKIKMIYIDPPYNTGSDFVYPDDYADSIGNYLKLTRQADHDGKLSTNTESDGRFHSKWLNMMYPRLKLARNLLADDGVILISINEKEQAHLRQVCDDLFGEKNLITQFVWLNEGNVDQQSKIKGVHEYVLAYARDASNYIRPAVIDPNITEDSKLYRDLIENSITKNGPANPPSEVELPERFPANFTHGHIKSRTDSYPHILDDIRVENGIVASPARVKSGWSSKNLLELFIRNGCSPIEDSDGRETWFELRETGAIYMMKRRSQNQGHVLSVLRNMGTTKKNSQVLKEWGLTFSYPKPLGLIEYLITVFVKANDDGLILDFFSGSATTAHAVMSANLRDGGRRRHIQIQMPEPIKGPGTATIADLARSRIKEARRELMNTRKYQLSSEENVRFDFGFRSYKLVDTNFLKWAADSRLSEVDLADLFRGMSESANDASEPEALLTEVLLKLGFSLSESIEAVDVDGLEVFSVTDGLVLAYLDEHTTPTLAQLRALVAEEPERLVILEDAFKGNDELKTNLVQECRTHNVELWTA